MASVGAGAAGRLPRGRGARSAQARCQGRGHGRTGKGEPGARAGLARLGAETGRPRRPGPRGGPGDEISCIISAREAAGPGRPGARASANLNLLSRLVKVTLSDSVVHNVLNDLE